MSLKTITLYLNVHQPFRIREYSVFDMAVNHNYFDETDYFRAHNNEQVFNKVADKSYRPMNALLLKILNSNPHFKLSLSISGVFIEQARAWAPDVLADFQELVRTGRVEILSETYYHSLAFFYSREEFERQVLAHRELIQETFGVTPTVFRGTELAYNDALAQWAENFGFKGILAEGWDPILDWRSPNFVYSPEGTQSIKLLMKNYKLSDDIAFRFSNRDWPEWPLTADKYEHWASQALDGQSNLNLFMDYETFGEHQWEDTGIFEFFEEFIARWSAQADRSFATVSEAIEQHESMGTISVPQTTTWADTERDLSAWLGNSMQQEAMKYLYQIEQGIIETGDIDLIADWRKLQTSDHTYYMCTKWLDDGAVHTYFSPYKSPYEAFLYFMNALRDIRWRLAEHTAQQEGTLNG